MQIKKLKITFNKLIEPWFGEDKQPNNDLIVKRGETKPPNNDLIVKRGETKPPRNNNKWMYSRTEEERRSATFSIAGFKPYKEPEGLFTRLKKYLTLS